MKNILILIFALVFISSLSLVNAADTQILKSDSQGQLVFDCMDENQVPCSAGVVCSFTIFYPGNNTEMLLNQIAERGSNYYYINLTTEQTSILGIYHSVVTCTDGATFNGKTSFDYEVNGSGQDVTQQQILLIMAGLVALFVFSIFFFVLSLIFKHPGTKIFLMALSGLTLIVLIGLMASQGSIYLAEFPSIVSVYSSYYILIIILAGVAVTGIMVWLIYYAVSMFNKSRGRIPDD